MLRFEQGQEHVSSFLQFRGGRVYDPSPAGALRLYFDQTAQNLLVSRDGGAYLPLTGSSDAAAWNVPGDGVTDATDALLALIARGDPITLEAGATYLVSRPLVLLPGQILHGNGATIKRANQIPPTTTTTAISSGVTAAITVASAANFRVGMGITIEQGGVYSPYPHIITSIVGNVITVDLPFVGVFTGTKNVYQGYHLIKTADDCAIRDLVIDGNRANWSFYRFEQTTDIGIYGDRNRISECHIHDSAGEAVTVFAGDYPHFVSLFIDNTNGNGIHLAQTAYPLVAFCQVIGVNLDTSVGHADGCIIASNNVSDATIVGNYCQQGISGIGSFDSALNSHVTICDNTIRDCTGTGLDLVTGSDEATTNMVITGNRIYGSVKVALQGVFGATQFPGRTVFADNLLENTYLQVYRCNNVAVHDNIVNGPANVTNIAIEVFDCKDVSVHHNQLVGFDVGVTTDGSRSENIAIEQNILRGQRSRGLFSNFAGGVNVSIEQNRILNAAGCQSSYDAIIGRDECKIEGNQIRLAAGVAAHSGIYAKEGARVRANTVIHGGATASIITDGGQTAATIIEDNYISLAVTDNSGAATLAGNRIIT